MVHDVRSDCVIVGRTGNLDDLGSKLDDPGKCGVLQGIWLCCYWENGWLTLLLCSEVDYSDLPPDPLKICIPKAASILMQPTDTIRDELYRIDDDHFVLGSMMYVSLLFLPFIPVPLVSPVAPLL